MDPVAPTGGKDANDGLKSSCFPMNDPCRHTRWHILSSRMYCFSLEGAVGTLLAPIRGEEAGDDLKS